jgi:SAM-dependent methyltransferase
MDGKVRTERESEIGGREYVISSEEKFSKAERYHGWVVDSFGPYFGSRILDIGCSVGNTTRIVLERYSPSEVVSIDVCDESVGRARDRLAGYVNFSAERLDVQDKAILDRFGGHFDTVVCINVLEHVEDDELALENIFGLLCGGGRLLLFVPAFMALYGNVDACGGHFRRYGHGELLRKVEAAGFAVRHIRYFNIFGVVPWFIYGRLAGKGRFPSASHIRLLDRFIGFADWFESKFTVPFGLSLWCVCEKVRT